MVKKFTVPCSFKNGQKIPVTLYVGDPAVGSHPFDFQSRWLSQTRGGSIPPEIMNSFEKLKKIADENRVSFEKLCYYVIEEINANQETVAEHERINEPLNNPPLK